MRRCAFATDVRAHLRYVVATPERAGLRAGAGARLKLPPVSAALTPDRTVAAPWRLIWALAAGATALRVLVLFVTPLELYPDEAQYWAWSRHLAFGYFSKPPMIAWLIAATTAVGGNAEPWVRLCAPLLHGGAALAAAAAAARLYGGRAATWAALVYLLMPGVQLSSGVVATDAPLLTCAALATWAYAALWSRPGLSAAAALGAALGLACLSKYAGLYLVLGLGLHAALDACARRAWSPGRLAMAAGVMLALWSPNLAWNALHHFQTLAHTAADADWRDPASATAKGVGLFDPRGAGGFVAGQFLVFGPVPFAALTVGLALVLARRRSLAGPDRLLACLLAPPLVLVFVEAAVARANANWAAAAYAPGTVLAAAWLGEDARARAWRGWGLGVQAVLAAAFMVAAADPALADAAGLGATFKRARGWRETTRRVDAFTRGLQASGPVDAVAVDDRFLFNALTYYGRDGLGAGGAVPLRMWVHEAQARNQAELEHPLTQALGARVAFASIPWTREARADFAQAGRVEAAAVPLDRRHARTLTLFEGRGFRPLARLPRR